MRCCSGDNSGKNHLIKLSVVNGLRFFDAHRESGIWSWFCRVLLNIAIYCNILNKVVVQEILLWLTD